MHELTQQMRDRRAAQAMANCYAVTAPSNAVYERAIASAYAELERALDLRSPVYVRIPPQANTEREPAIAIAYAENTRATAPALAEYRRTSAETETHTHQ